MNKNIKNICKKEGNGGEMLSQIFNPINNNNRNKINNNNNDNNNIRVPILKLNLSRMKKQQNNLRT